ncbi:hypothetical protein ADJ73_04795 [Arsenicicoccus sp. oral taxon 190]|nr:hypothetical protein ADJ73_04795 [Arsenicicoccus sp. oral taxon 190]
MGQVGRIFRIRSARARPAAGVGAWNRARTSWATCHAICTSMWASLAANAAVRRACCLSVRFSTPARRIVRIPYNGSPVRPRCPRVSCWTRRRTSSTHAVASLTTWNASTTATASVRCSLIAFLYP